jgi:hypothetical protein
MKTQRAELARTLDRVEEDFIGLWRSMSSLWGISPTMAEIHGLLFITGATLSLTSRDGGQADGKFGAAADFALHVDAAAVRLDDLARSG